MFELFNGVSDGELKGIYKDILKSEKDGLRPKSLDSYAKKLQKICKFTGPRSFPAAFSLP